MKCLLGILLFSLVSPKFLFAITQEEQTVNLLFVLSESGQRRALIPDPLFAPIRADIESKFVQIGLFPNEIVWINTMESDVYQGGVHCLTNPKRRLE